MPIVKYYLVEGRHSDAAIGQLLTRSCGLFAEVLECPIDRVRAFAHEFRPATVCVGGELASDGAADAPYFRFMLLAGRSVEQRQRLLTGFTDLLVECLGVERAGVRGGMWLVEPENWAIAGTPASVARKSEVDARVSGAKASDEDARGASGA